MKRTIVWLSAALVLPFLMAASCGTPKAAPVIEMTETTVNADAYASAVYFTKDISPEGLMAPPLFATPEFMLWVFAPSFSK